jgi:hypothetical protein
MNKSDVFLIISQIFVAGTLVVQKNKVAPPLFATIWLILSYIAWGNS